MLRTIIALFLISIFAVSAHSQATASQKAQNEACDCLKKIDRKVVNTDEKLKNATIQCLTTAMTTNIIGLAEENGYTLAEINEEVGQKIGERFGIELATTCPIFLEYSATMADELSEEDKKSSMDRMRGFDATGAATGTFVRLDLSGEFAKVVIKNSQNQEETFVWTRRFDGSSLLETDVKPLIGKKVTIGWGEYEKFNPKTRTYTTIREITKLSKQ
jgi:hypothetical protein